VLTVLLEVVADSAHTQLASALERLGAAEGARERLARVREGRVLLGRWELEEQLAQAAAQAWMFQDKLSLAAIGWETIACARPGSPRTGGGRLSWRRRGGRCGRGPRACRTWRTTSTTSMRFSPASSPRAPGPARQQSAASLPGRPRCAPGMCCGPAIRWGTAPPTRMRTRTAPRTSCAGCPG
jgi:hypothetical protein